MEDCPCCRYGDLDVRNSDVEDSRSLVSYESLPFDVGV